MMIDMGPVPEIIYINFVQYKCQLSTANPCGSNIILLLQTWIISVLQRVAEVLRKLFLVKNNLRITHFCWSQMTRFAKMGLQMHPIEKPQLKCSS